MRYLALAARQRRDQYGGGFFGGALDQVPPVIGDVKFDRGEILLWKKHSVDGPTWEHHLRQGDYSRWFRECIKVRPKKCTARLPRTVVV